MTRSMITKWNSVVTALEDLILVAPDSDLTQDRVALAEAQDVRKLIEPKAKQTRSKVLTVRADLAGQLALLRELAKTRPELKPRLGLVFGTKGKASAGKVNELIEELIRSGILKKDKR